MQLPPKGRPSLTRERVVDAALDLIDEAGVEGVSMRKLGARLGVEAMTLYYYVPNKDALLDLVVERVTMRAAEANEAEGKTWRERLEGFARRYRAALIARPRVLPLISTRPVRSPEAVEQFMAALTGMAKEGFEPKVAYFALHAVVMLVIGMAIAEAGEHPEGAEPAHGEAETAYLKGVELFFGDPAAFETRHRDAFEFALEALLDGLETKHSRSPACLDRGRP